MARQLAKFGAEALKPQLVEGVWHKPKISGRIAAKLKKQFLQEGKVWPVAEEPKKDTKHGFGLKKAPKGHKHDKLAELRRKEIQENLEAMPEKIAEYRESRKLKDSSVLDQLLLTPKERRMKQYRLPK